MLTIQDQDVIYFISEENVTFINCKIFYARAYKINLDNCVVFGFLDNCRLFVKNSVTDLITNSKSILSNNSKINLTLDNYVCIDVNDADVIVNGELKSIKICIDYEGLIDFSNTRAKTVNVFSYSNNHSIKYPESIERFGCFGSETDFPKLPKLKFCQIYLDSVNPLIIPDFMYSDHLEIINVGKILGKSIVVNKLFIKGEIICDHLTADTIILNNINRIEQLLCNRVSVRQIIDIYNEGQ